MSSITNGWNVVLALDETQVNALLQQQYLKYAGGGDMGGPLTFGIMQQVGGDDFPYGAVVSLAAPQIELLALAGGQTATTSVQVNSAFVVWAQGAMWFSPQCLQVQRNIELQQLAGTVDNSIGSVALTFPATGTQASPSSLYAGLTDYLANGLATLTLGDIINTNPGPGLEPATFQFAIQTSGTSSALLLFITTVGGQPGSSPSLTQYPLTANVTAALILSEEQFWSEVMPAAMETALNTSAANAGYTPLSPITFSAQQGSDGAWSVTCNGGTATMGYWGYLDGTMESWVASTGALQLPLNGGFQLTIASDGSVQQSSSGTVNTNWMEYISGQLEPTIRQWAQTFSFSYACAGQLEIDSTNDAVTFGNSRTLTVESGGVQWDMSVITQSASQSAGTSDGSPFSTEVFFPATTAPSVITFALANLLFPNGTELSLDTASMPGDLVLTGTLDQVFSIQPQSVTLEPSATQPFTASATDVRWGCSAGSIDHTSGLFTAPAANAAQTISITAMNMANNDVTHAAVTIAVPNTGLVVSPTTVFMMMGFPIFATDTSGNPVEVTCSTTYSNATLSRQAVGQWLCSLNTFPEMGDTFIVTVTSGSLSATINVIIAACDSVTVSFDPSSGIASATSAAGNSEFYWAVSPASAGSAAPVPGNPAQANVTITAPRSVYAVCAYYADIDSGSYGFGESWQNLPGPGQ